MPQCRLLPVGTFPIWAWFTLIPTFWKLALWLRTSCYCLMSFKEYWYLSQVMAWPRHLAWTHQKCTNATILQRKEVIDIAHSCRGLIKAKWEELERSGITAPPRKKRTFFLFTVQSTNLREETESLPVLLMCLITINSGINLNLHTSILGLWFGHGDKAEEAGAKEPVDYSNLWRKS